VTSALEHDSRRRSAVFLDKDGTLISDVPFNTDPERVQLMPSVGPGLQLLARAGLPLFIVTNQPGLASGQISHAVFKQLAQRLEQRLRTEASVELEAWLVCPHGPDAGCDCRKPAAGLLQQAARVHGIDLSQSWMVGDILDDVEAGRRAGCRSILVDVGNETLWHETPWREPHHICANFMEAAQLIVRDLPQRH